MEILTPQILQSLKPQITDFTKELQARDINRLDSDEQCSLIIEAASARGWKSSVIRTGFYDTSCSRDRLIDIFEIYINVGYGCYVSAYVSDPNTELPDAGWSELPRLAQNSFIGQHLHYYAQANRYDIVKMED